MIVEKVCTSEPRATVPCHVAIIMDGNRRWAAENAKPFFFGHKMGMRALERAVSFALKNDIRVLTLYAFSQENWKRPPNEVAGLLKLFAMALRRRLAQADREAISFRVIGDRTPFSQTLQDLIAKAESRTAHHSRMVINLAANYSARWEITQAVRSFLNSPAGKSLDGTAITECQLEQHMALQAPAVDLLIRTGGEYRLSNFLLWHLAYTELYFTKVLWPAFDEQAFREALAVFSHRERRFGGSRLDSKTVESSDE